MDKGRDFQPYLELLIVENFAKTLHNSHSFRKNSWGCKQNGLLPQKNPFFRRIFRCQKCLFFEKYCEKRARAKRLAPVWGSEFTNRYTTGGFKIILAHAKRETV